MGKEILKLRASYHTLGCKLNFSETSAIGRSLRACGIVTAQPDETPDIVVINTCSVTETADHKGRQLIRKLGKRWPDASIVVTGCYAQLKPQEVAALPGVNLVLGTNEKLKAAEFIDKWLSDRNSRIEVTRTKDIKDFSGTCERGDRTRWFLKVQDGCDYYCTYCTIPYARGRSRSGNISDLIKMAEDAAESGAREIVITGVNIGDFGRDTDADFLSLIRELDRVEGIERFRISSIEPNLLTDEIIDFTAGSRAFMPHFHIPLQSGSDNVLKMMNRRYDTSLFRERINHIRRVIPNAYIGVDVIAGARGETSEEWEKAREFVESLPVTRLHVFPYSERPGTSALQLPNPVKNSDRQKRVAELIAISDAKLNAFIASQKGETRPVLWEHSYHDGRIYGFTDNYIRVGAEWQDSLPNTITDVTLDNSTILPDQ